MIFKRICANKTGEGFVEDCGQLSLYFRTFSNIAGMFGYKTNLSVVITDELLQPTLDTEGEQTSFL